MRSGTETIPERTKHKTLRYQHDSRVAIICGVVIPRFTGTHFRGFWCNDDSIKYIYKGDTITVVELFVYVFAVMMLPIVATEVYRARLHGRSSFAQFKLGNVNIHPTTVPIMSYFGYSQLGFVAVFVITETTKNCIGRLRPHFLDVLQQLYMQRQCRYGRRGSEVVLQRALCVFHIYLLTRLPHNSLRRVALPVCQIAVICTGKETIYYSAIKYHRFTDTVQGLLISYSRINDNKHHWSDVMVGIFVGTMIAIYTCLVWAQMFTKSSEELISINQVRRVGEDEGANYSASTSNMYESPEEK
ncbi:unnamed protein product [Nippostrongylus brasiliensis]|uniref:AcidPPc domain-containing protein n=1 Tax=Nippostrongylus brasiliensis TaxID=27835 RepID=A0A0N4Y7F8_NIPBR|nr:unnamed protein product [Nippostrongylus brasiliensis]